MVEKGLDWEVRSSWVQILPGSLAHHTPLIKPLYLPKLQYPHADNRAAVCPSVLQDHARPWVLPAPPAPSRTSSQLCLHMAPTPQGLWVPDTTTPHTVSPPEIPFPLLPLVIPAQLSRFRSRDALSRKPPFLHPPHFLPPECF